MNKVVSRCVAAAAVLALITFGGSTAANAEEVLPQPSVSQSFLDANYVTGDVIDVQVDDKGAKFYQYSDGDYVFEPPAPTGSTARYNAGACAGTFVNIYRNGFGELYWGGQNVCASSGTFYKHSLKIQLRKGCTGIGCGQANRSVGISADSPYNAVQTVNRFSKCRSAVNYRYDMIAYPTVRSVQYGPFVDVDNFVVGCNY